MFADIHRGSIGSVLRPPGHDARRRKGSTHKHAAIPIAPLSPAFVRGSAARPAPVRIASHQRPGASCATTV